MTRLIAIAGGSGACKTTVALALQKRLAPNALVVAEDDFYRCSSTIPDFDAATHNFDAPAAKDEAALHACLSRAREGQPFEKPIYDMTTHRRLIDTETVTPREYLIVEGIHILAFQSLRPLFDLAVFMHSDESLRLGRRMIRDMETRARSPRSIVQQFFATVRPMHEAFVEPQRAFADLVLVCAPGAGFEEAEVHADIIVQRLRELASA